MSDPIKPLANPADGVKVLGAAAGLAASFTGVDLTGEATTFLAGAAATIFLAGAAATIFLAGAAGAATTFFTGAAGTNFFDGAAATALTGEAAAGFTGAATFLKKGPKAPTES